MTQTIVKQYLSRGLTLELIQISIPKNWVSHRFNISAIIFI